MKILIIRHADPDYEHDSLTDVGFKEAEILKSRLLKENPKTIYLSPLGRAQRTAEPYLKATNKKGKTLPWLREFHAPVKYNDGKPTVPWDIMPKYVNEHPTLLDNQLWCNTQLMKSGNVKKEYDRVIKGFDKILSEHGYERDGLYYKVNRSNSDTIMLFCHFGVECVILSHLMNCSPIALLQGFCAAPSSVTTIYTEEREQGYAHFRTASFGDISHLYAKNEEPSFAARFCETYDNFEQRH